MGNPKIKHAFGLLKTLNIVCILDRLNIHHGEEEIQGSFLVKDEVKKGGFVSWE
jgi:hypothetical protein